LKFRLVIAVCLLAVAGGCGFLPHISRQPVVRNPFPQLSRVAVAPFFNQSDEKTVDGREFAIAYFNELQATPGFEVVPVNVVEEAMLRHQIGLNSPLEARQLAKILGVDAVVIGTVTEFSPYYPPRCGIRVEWWTANPSFHPIPAGYGLPWGTPEEEFIPAPLVYEAELALAREQMKTQTPDCSLVAPVPEVAPPKLAPVPDPAAQGAESKPEAEKIAHEQPLPVESVVAGPHQPPTTIHQPPAPIPQGWPDPQGFVPPGPSPVRPPCVPSRAPVLSHTAIYHGTDGQFTAALENYAYFRDDARPGGWQSYLEQSDEFIRFCCHLHISEMLTARGGAAESRVVWRWADNR
jgi:hypothetical protein